MQLVIEVAMVIEVQTNSLINQLTAPKA